MGSLSHVEAVERVEVVLSVVVVVGDAEIKVLLIQADISREVWDVSTIEERSDWVTLSVAEVAGFVHVKPQTIVLNKPLQVAEHRLPVCCSIGVRPVNEGSWSRPYISYKNPVFVWALQEDVHASSVIEGYVVDVCNSTVQDRDIVLRHVVESVHKGWQACEVCLIDGEVGIVLHVVDVAPEHVQRQVVFSVVAYNPLKSCGVGVAPPALVPSQAPVGHEGRLANQGVVLLDNILNIGAKEAVEVDGSSDSSEGDEVICAVYVGIEGVAVQQEASCR
mmetsp:Transcript_10601/g.20456  ORF Transcript_10601/g.20456 Transcript_10601/m.20456 type:complete len:277 (-) Transcript_10601:647-1477(-)